MLRLRKIGLTAIINIPITVSKTWFTLKAASGLAIFQHAA
jgi:hypothetical protein